jgi:Nucleotide modification associated domain 3
MELHCLLCVQAEIGVVQSGLFLSKSERAMKLILSRKGFDSGNGGVASPILLPGDTLLSLPIREDKESPISYGDLQCRGVSLGKIVSDLTEGRLKAVRADDQAHLDPHLDSAPYHNHTRLPGWCPLFGQDGAAQTHLKRHEVQDGDLFLFFGWFRRAKLDKKNDRYHFVKDEPDLHVVYGWLQVGKKITGLKPNDPRAPDWAKYHPHLHGKRPNNNTIYISSEKLHIPGVNSNIPGGGIFRKFHSDLQLTAPGGDRRSVWRLPAWFYPKDERVALSYHRNRDNRWEQRGGWTFLRSVGRGQEFVLDVKQYPEAIGWIDNLMTHAL